MKKLTVTRICIVILLVCCAILSGCKAKNTGADDTESERAKAVVPEGAWGLSIAGAYDKANNIITKYADSDRNGYYMENSQMSCTYEFDEDGHKVLRNLTSSEGNLYVEETDDVFVRTEDGIVLYSSQGTENPRANMFRFGMYYSDVRILDGSFAEPLDKADRTGKALKLSLDHTFALYSDKMNSVAHVVATKEVTGIAAIGLITKIDAETVDNIVIKDENGLHYSLDDVDFATAEYVGFHIKGTGVLGYILLQDSTSGSLSVELSEGEYIIIQERTPANGKIASKKSFYIGRRIYTDTNDTFDAFLTEAEYERHPLDSITSEGFAEYDALRGAYVVNMDSTNFNDAYFTNWNNHYPTTLTVNNSGDTERSIYILTTSTSGCLECSAVLDENNTLLPISVEVHKNFSGEGEEALYNRLDIAYGEGLFPITLSGNQSLTFTVLNLFQNWGNYPLKQISSIQFGAPYYHLSTGITETTCIAPWYVSWQDNWTLTDFRPMSAPFWYEMEGEYYNNQPQHTHGGYQYFLQYKDSDGNKIASECVGTEVLSTGMSYASVKMNYLSDDGKIKVSYTQTEMPQTDENRVYYEIEYTVLDTVSFNDFKRDFSFYSAYAYAGKYQTIGYLDGSNNCAVSDTHSGTSDEYIVLGSDCPYFALYNYEEDSHNGFIDNGNNTNLGCSILEYSAVIGNKKYNGNLCVALNNYGARLTLNCKEVTLKKGDKITIKMIIGPWGYQESTDDSNVRNIRQYSCLNPLSVSCDDGSCKITQDGFLPTLISNDGESAVFTVSGGMNNSAIRVYGYTKLTKPVLYEEIDGQWVEVELSSQNSPDSSGNAHNYDGYTVYYDGDGTYSYAFVCEMTGTSRKFKLECR